MIRWLHPKRCRATLPPHEETKSIECHAMAEKISSYSLPPIPGVASSAASMLPVQAAGAVLLKAPLSPPCDNRVATAALRDNAVAREPRFHPSSAMQYWFT